MVPYNEACLIHCPCCCCKSFVAEGFQNSLNQASENLKACRLVILFIIFIFSAFLVTTEHIGKNPAGQVGKESNRELIVPVLAEAHVK